METEILAVDLRLSQNREWRPDGTQAGEDGLNSLLSNLAHDGYSLVANLGEFVLIFEREVRLGEARTVLRASLAARWPATVYALRRGEIRARWSASQA